MISSHALSIETHLTAGAAHLAYALIKDDNPLKGRFFEVCWTTE